MIRTLFLAALLASACAGQARDLRVADAVELWQAGDFRAAERLLRPLARAGDPAAETLLGVIAARGLTGESNAAVAAAWYFKAARRGFRPAQLALADAYRRGAGVPRSDARAFALERAANGAP
jgi:TPR repeat protein